MLSRIIDLELLRRLRDRKFRTGYFEAEVENTIPERIRALRKRRDMKQADLATATGMKRSAVARIEKRTYGRWNISTLLRVADALDARLIVGLEASEDFLNRFEAEEAAGKNNISVADSIVPQGNSN